MFRHSRLVRSSALIVLLAAVMFWSGDRARASQAVQGTVLLGPIGVAKNEAVRVNVYGIGDPDDVPWGFVVRIFNTVVRSLLSGDSRSPPASRAPSRSTSAIRTSSRSKHWDGEPCAPRSWASTHSPTVSQRLARRLILAAGL